MGIVLETLIIEDEKPAARLLQRKLEKLGYVVLAQLHSVADAIAWFSKNQAPPLVFVDIQLSDGLSFEIFEHFEQQNTPVKSAIVFTTAYDTYTLKAFKLHSIDYLLKPIDSLELEEAIQKFNTVSSQNALEIPSIAQLKSILSTNTISYKSRFTLQVGSQLKIIDTKEISCFYSENKGTYLNTLENRNYLIDGSLEQVEADLDPKQFFRINRKYLVALSALAEIQVHSNSRLKVQIKGVQDNAIIVSRERVADFKKWIS